MARSAAISSPSKHNLSSSMAVDLIRKHARASSSLTRDETRQMQAACDISKKVRKESVVRLIAASDHRPCLQSCSADATPIQVSVEVQKHLPNGRLIRRGGKASHELLINVQFLRYVDELSNIHTVAGVRDPIPLTHGKSSDAIFSGLRAVWGSLRMHGHRGGAIQHYGFDRCGFTALRRRTMQYHQLLQGSWASEVHSSNVLSLLEWVVFTPCALHDAQNAFKWCMKAFFGDVDIMKAIFIGVCSVRNSMDVIITYIAEWVSVSFSFAEPLSDEEKGTMDLFWSTLQVPEDLKQLLVHALELRVENNRLLVKAGIPTPDVINMLVPTLLGVWRITKYCDSRWISVGRSSRGFVVAQITGI